MARLVLFTSPAASIQQRYQQYLVELRWNVAAMVDRVRVSLERGTPLDDAIADLERDEQLVLEDLHKMLL